MAFNRRAKNKEAFFYRRGLRLRFTVLSTPPLPCFGSCVRCSALALVLLCPTAQVKNFEEDADARTKASSSSAAAHAGVCNGHASQGGVEDNEDVAAYLRNCRAYQAWHKYVAESGDSAEG